MARKTRTYSRVKEASDMIAKLHKKYTDVFWCVNPEAIAVMGVDNVERSEKAVAKQPIWSKMRNVKGVERAIFQENNIGERYIIECFWSDWHLWNDATKAAVLASHLLEITPEVEVKNRPDCIGFKILYDVLGVNWEYDTSNKIPNILTTDVKFNLDLRPGLAELKALEEDGGPEDPDDVI
ncbi:MAG: hypothetical protein WC119_02810 [Synergistaceae bacterium]